MGFSGEELDLETGWGDLYSVPGLILFFALKSVCQPLFAGI